MDDEAEKLAQAFLNSGKGQFSSKYNITEHGQSTGEVIVIIAIKKNESVYKSVAGPKGIVCPACNGTGRLG